MKKLIVGAAFGAIAAAVIYALKKDGKLDEVCDNLNVYARKTKRNLKNAADVSKNEVEYLKERVAYEIGKSKK